MPITSGKVSCILKAERLVKRFGDVTAVNELSLDIRSGEILALLGPNGAGKTVTISMLCGLLKPDSGSIFFNDKPLEQSMKSDIGLCPQNIIIWPKQTCLEQLVFIGEMYDLPRKMCRQRAEDLMAIFHLTEKRRKLAATLSGGMQRRLNLALALMHDPKLLILDEPEAGLDPQSRVLVREYVRDWAKSNKEHTVILTTHNMDEADRMADRVAIIDHGALLALDTPNALRRNLGEGDVLEIDLNNGDLSQNACRAIKSIVNNVTLQNNILVMRALGIVDLLPAITRRINDIGIKHGDIRLRGNTLEDVFIALTGRRLRE